MLGIGQLNRVYHKVDQLDNRKWIFPKTSEIPPRVARAPDAVADFHGLTSIEVIAGRYNLWVVIVEWRTFSHNSFRTRVFVPPLTLDRGGYLSATLRLLIYT
ncbi:hypothetical protein QUF64_15680 [Anaerolineales bacterium HSG6]|nr:hypothetical protein [Anaerolineales bacterium HSG6]MDM8529883.1 hypothetical protein [Anaerolineales bacterium HSG25]